MTPVSAHTGRERADALRLGSECVTCVRVYCFAAFYEANGASARSLSRPFPCRDLSPPRQTALIATLIIPQSSVEIQSRGWREGPTGIRLSMIAVGVAVRILVLVCVWVLLTCGLVLVARATYKRHNIRGTDDVETAYVTAMATLYGIFIAFMIFIVWNKYKDVRDSVASEANKLRECYWLAGGLDSPAGDHVRGLVTQYARSVIHDEWDTMTSGRPSARTQGVIDAAWNELNVMGRDAANDSVVRDHLLSAWSDVTELRQLRLERASAGLAPMAYALLILGGLITIGLACLFTVDNLATHVIKAAALGSVIIVMLSIIWGLDHPFRSPEVGLTPEPFVHVLQLSQGGTRR